MRAKIALFRAPPMASPSRLPIRPISSSVHRDFKIPSPIISSISIRTPRKFTDRKNYLRQKLLKNLPTPHPNSLIFELTPETAVTVIDSPAEENSIIPSKQVLVGGELELEEFKVQEIQQSEVVESVKAGKFSKDSVFKFGLWLVGAFVFQTICAVWVLGSADIDDKSENGVVSEDKGAILEVGSKSKSSSIMGFENYGDLNEEEMEKKIEGIRVMAREAREREKLRMKKNGSENNDGDKEDEKEEFGKSGIEKEVNDRLNRLRKRLEKFPVAFFDNVKKVGNGKDGKGKNDLNGKEAKEITFKKKYKFRGSSGGHADIPKGFMPSDHLAVHKEVRKEDEGEVLMNGGIGRDGGSMVDDEWELDRPVDNSGADTFTSVRVHGEKSQTSEETKSSSSMGKKSEKERKRRKQGKIIDVRNPPRMVISCNPF